MTLEQSMAGTIAGGLIAIIAGLMTAIVQFKLTKATRREQYQREDRFRLYEKRVEVYSAFNVAAGAMRRALTSGGGIEERSECKVEARDGLFKAYIPILLIAVQQVRSAAWSLMRITDAFVYDGEQFDAEAWLEAIESVREACRRDLLQGAEDETA